MNSKDTLRLGTVILAERPKRRRTESRFDIGLLRLREIEAVVKSRHGYCIPDPAGTDDRDRCTAYVIAVALSHPGQDVADWCARYAPWISQVEILEIEAKASGRKRMLGADAAAKMLFVSLDERNRLGLRTIGACDVSSEERQNLAKERKRDQDRARQTAKRRAEGIQDRESLEGQSISARKPWEAEGVSRRTWYRRRGTVASRVDIESNGDAAVPSTSVSGETPLSREKENPAGGEAERHGAWGSHPQRRVREAEPHGIGDASLAKNSYAVAKARGWFLQPAFNSARGSRP